MNFNHLGYLPGLIVILLVFVAIIFVMEKKFFRIIKTYWFFNRSVFSYLSSILFLAGMSGLLFSLLDLRGPEEKIKTEVPQDRTIILIDTSASMLAEDVKPSRLQKAVLMAKHFARKAAGQQLSIVAFAEVQKKIVPFTNDLDLIDSRLDSIKNLRNQYGSSALTLAIQESIQYFREVGGEASGNILVYTDGEETAEGIKLKVPKDIHVALVGVGTTRGGRIPLDDGRGFRFGYKKDKGRDVITKLNEDFFKKAVADLGSGKYWLANSYSLPSTEILEFFRAEKKKSAGSQDMVIKPVLVQWIVVPSLLLLILSYGLKFIRVFALLAIILFSPVQAQEDKVELSPAIQEKLLQLEKGDLNQLERIKLADELREAGAKTEALSLYEENLPLKKINLDLPSEAYLNYGTSLLEKGEAQKGLKVYEKLKEAYKGKDEAKKINDLIDKNVVAYFKKEEQQKKEQQKKKDNKENKDDKDQQDQKNQQGQSGQSGKQDQNQKGQKGQNKKEDSAGEDDQKDKKDKKDKNDGDDQEDKDQGDQDKDKKDSKDAKESEGEKKPMPPKKIPAKLKQLMYDDRQLQMRMIESGTRDLNKRKSRKSKDW